MSPLRGKRKLDGDAKRVDKLLITSILCFLVSLCLLGGPSELVKATVQTKYYFQPVNVRPGEPDFLNDYYLDTPLPQGPTVESSYGVFHTRELIDDHTFYAVHVVMHVKPENVARKLTIAAGHSDTWFHFTWWVKSTYALPSGKTFINFTFILPAKTLAAGQRLCFSVESIEPSGVFLFGDLVHSSYIETDDLNLSGQPIPEFPFPVVTLLITFIMTVAIKELRIKRSRTSL